MMITVGIDPHMKTHTAVALDAAVGRVLEGKTVGCTERGRGALLIWARSLGADRYFAMHDGTAPLPVSSGKSERHRLNRTGNRTLDSAIHMVAVTQVRMHPPGRVVEVDFAADPVALAV